MASASTFTIVNCESATDILVRDTRRKSIRQAHELYKEVRRPPDWNSIPSLVFNPALMQAAALGDIEATFRLAQNYLNGLGTAKDPIRAAELFQMASDKGHAQSTYALAIM